MRFKTLPPRRLGILIAIGSAIIFGVWPPAARAVYADGGNAVLLMLANAWGRALAMVLFCVITHKGIFKTGADRRNALTGGIFQMIAMLGLYKSTELLPGSVAIVILFSHSLLLLLFMAWRREIKLDAATVGTTIAALVGLSLVVDFWDAQTGSYFIGVAWGVVAAVASMSRLYVFNTQTRERHPIVVGAENFLMASVLLLPVAAIQMPTLPTTHMGYVWLAVSCTSAIIGVFGMFYGIAMLGSFRYSLFLKLEPVFTAVFSAVLISEILKSSQYVGMIVVIGSLAIYQLCDHRRKATVLDKGVPE